MAPMGFSHVWRLCLQGGGVLIYGGTVSFSLCTITGNTAYNVHAHAQTSHRPHGKITDVLALTHACTTANASVNYSRYVPQRPSKVPIAPMGNADALALMGNADALALIHACTTVSDAPMNYRMYVPQRPRKFPWPRWENALLSLN